MTGNGADNGLHFNNECSNLDIHIGANGLWKIFTVLNLVSDGIYVTNRCFKRDLINPAKWPH